MQIEYAPWSRNTITYYVDVYFLCDSRSPYLPLVVMHRVCAPHFPAILFDIHSTYIASMPVLVNDWTSLRQFFSCRVARNPWNPDIISPLFYLPLSLSSSTIIVFSSFLISASFSSVFLLICLCVCVCAFFCSYFCYAYSCVLLVHIFFIRVHPQFYKISFSVCSKK